jgi:UDP-N-acetylglucosamine 2-epimerase (non-hydrolysing)
MAPLINRLRRTDFADVVVVGTGQHRDMLYDALTMFGIKADFDLQVMQPDQTLPRLTANLIDKLDPVIEKVSPSIILAEGDTTSVLVAALLAFYRRIPFGHVEAGLRTGNLLSPFPEEFNRVAAGRLAAVHFAPTERARANLLKEGVAETSIHVTGNTVIDALLEVASWKDEKELPIPPDSRLVLITAHRRENFGQPLKNIFGALARLCRQYDDLHFLFPVHPNPKVQHLARAMLGEERRIRLVEPLNYREIVTAMKRASIVLTDSGGIQEEAPALGKPVLVMRDTTERPEAVEAGVAKLVGTDEDNIVREASRLLSDPDHYKSMARGASPYGDGHASERIIRILEAMLQSGAGSA